MSLDCIISPIYHCFQKHLPFLVSAASTTKSGWLVVCTVSVLILHCGYMSVLFKSSLYYYCCLVAYAVLYKRPWCLYYMHYPEGLITESFPNLPDSFLISLRMIVEFYISTGIVF